MSNKDVFPPAVPILAILAMIGIGNHKQIKILVGFDQRVDHLNRGSKVDVVVGFAHDQQQSAVQVFRVGQV